MIATNKHDHPQWIIDDTAGITDARVFVVHTTHPRCIGEAMPDDEHDPSGTTFSLPTGETLCKITWIDHVAGLPDAWWQSFIESLHAAWEHHWAVRERKEAEDDDN